jgi:hypothetical protein
VLADGNQLLRFQWAAGLFLALRSASGMMRQQRIRRLLLF